MIYATTVTTKEELEQIHTLNKKNFKDHISNEEKQQEGFVTWLYSLDLLQQIHQLAASVIVKDDNKVAGYALVTPRDASAFHPDLKTMVNNLESLNYRGAPLKAYDYYIMGQICIDKAYRRKGIFNMLYQHHKKLYGNTYELLVTEISASNSRSQKAHEKIGFKTIHTYHDAMDEWNVVTWDWSED